MNSDQPTGKPISQPLGVTPPVSVETVADSSAGEPPTLLSLRERLRANAAPLPDAAPPAPSVTPNSSPFPPQSPSPLFDGPVEFGPARVEVEMKFRMPVVAHPTEGTVSDIAGFRETLVKVGGPAMRRAGRVREEDIYYTAPQMAPDTYLRVRDTTELATHNRTTKRDLTWKGPRISEASKSRHEETVYIDEAAGHMGAITRLLAGIGFARFAEVGKTRESFVVYHAGQEVTVTIDKVDGLGDFVEIEILTIEPAASGAVAIIADLARKLKLGDQERRGYADLVALKKKGAYVGSYDGISDVEAGFIAAPALTLTADPGGGGIVGGPPPNNTYLYTACYEWTDRAGNVHRSEPCIPKSIALTGPNDAVDIVITTLCLTRRGDAEDGEMRDVTIALFRTTITGQIFYRLLPPKLSESDALANDKTVNTVTFKDVLSDAGLVALGYGYVYTDGGIASNSPVITSQASCSWGNRLWLGTGKTLYFSKLFVEGEAPGFNEGLSLTLDDSPDGITAIAGLGDKLIVWTASRVYYVTGDGPNDTGDPVSGGFTTRLIATDTGCVDGRSVAVIPAGVMFMSSNGIRIVNGAPAVDDIGAPVQDETRGATVVRAVVDSARQRVKFLLDYGTSEGKYVVFDWHMNAWTTEQPYGRTLGDPPVAAPTRPACFTLWQGKWVQSTDYAGVMQEAAATEAGTDAGSYFPMILETPWFHLAGLGGHTRVWKTTVIGERFAPHTMRLDVFNDYSDAAVAQSRTIDLGGASTVVGLPVVKVAISHKVQQVAAVKIRISDVENGAVTVSPSGYDVAAVRLDVGVEQGSRRLPAANKR